MSYYYREDEHLQMEIQCIKQAHSTLLQEHIYKGEAFDLLNPSEGIDPEYGQPPLWQQILQETKEIAFQDKMEVEKNPEMSFRSSGNLSFHHEKNLNTSRLT